jgi:hypothetical protein
MTKKEIDTLSTDLLYRDKLEGHFKHKLGGTYPFKIWTFGDFHITSIEELCSIYNLKDFSRSIIMLSLFFEMKKIEAEKVFNSSMEGRAYKVSKDLDAIYAVLEWMKKNNAELDQVIFKFSNPKLGIEKAQIKSDDLKKDLLQNLTYLINTRKYIDSYEGYKKGYKPPDNQPLQLLQKITTYLIETLPKLGVKKSDSEWFKFIGVLLKILDSDQPKDPDRTDSKIVREYLNEFEIDTDLVKKLRIWHTRGKKLPSVMGVF